MDDVRELKKNQSGSTALSDMDSCYLSLDLILNKDITLQKKKGV